MRGLAAAAFLLAAQDPGIEHTKDTLEMVKAALAKKDAVLVDVRENNEWEAGHLEAALFLPLSWLRSGKDLEGFAEKLGQKLPAKKILYIHCRSGARALTAAGILKKAGYEVRPLKPGFEELRKAGLAEAKVEK